MAEITISDLPSKTALLDSDLVPIDDGTQSYRVTGAQLREFLKVNFLPLGTIVWSQSNLATDNVGRLPLWTGEYIASAATLYPDFYAWVKKHAELCKTKEQYDAALAQFGECPFYVVDEEEGSLRLPKLQHYIKNATAEEGITQKEAGLPNITGSVSGVRAGPWVAKGALAATKTSTTSQTMTDHLNQADLTIELDASLSSTAYGKSDTVTPAHTTLYPWVYAYNSAIPASTAQVAEFQSALSGKADNNLGNVTEDGQKTAVAWVMPDYSRSIATGLTGSPTSASTTSYTCPTNGWINLQANRNVDGHTLFFRVNGINRADFPAFTKTSANLMYPVNKGDVVSLVTDTTSATWSINRCYFFPCKGA